MPPTDPSRPSPWVSPPFLLTACLVLLGFGVSWGVVTTVVDSLRTALARNEAGLNQCLADGASVRLRVNTLENESAGRDRLWLEKWNTIDTRSQRIESMLEELLRGRTTRAASYR